MTIKIIEIFPYLACYGEKVVVFLFLHRDKDKHKISETKWRRSNWNNFLKSDIYDAF